MSFTPLNTLRAYWEALRDGSLPPERSQIDPRGIENALAHAFIVERIAPGIARFRIAGMYLLDVMGMEVRGMPLSALMEPETRETFARDLERVFAKPGVAEFAVTSPARFRQPALQGKLLLLPLRDGAERISCALGGLVMEGGLGIVPRRLTPLPLLMEPLAPARPRIDEQQDSPGLAEPPAVFNQATTSQRPHLRLITD